MSIKQLCILLYGATILALLHWQYRTDLAGLCASLVVGIFVLVLFLPPHVVAWWHQCNTRQRDGMATRWLFGVVAVLLVAFGLAHDAWHYGFLRTHVDLNALHSYVDCRLEKALNDCCPAACVDLNMTQIAATNSEGSQRVGDRILAEVVSELTNDSCHNMNHDWKSTSDCNTDAPWKGVQIMVDLPHLLKVEL